MADKEIILTDHAEKENEIPDWEITNIIQKKQGQLFKDRKNDSWARSKGKTVVIFEKKQEQGKTVVITAFRKDSPTYFSGNRFKKVQTIEV